MGVHDKRVFEWRNHVVDRTGCKLGGVGGDNVVGMDGDDYIGVAENSGRQITVGDNCYKGLKIIIIRAGIIYSW